jgi:hypothetical protein
MTQKKPVGEPTGFKIFYLQRTIEARSEPAKYAAAKSAANMAFTILLNIILIPFLIFWF